MANTPQVECFEIMELVLKNQNMVVGQQLKVKGKIPEDCESFEIDLGKDSTNLAVSFKPLWDDPVEGTIILVNSMTDGIWNPNPERFANTLQRDTIVMIVIDLEGKYYFKIQLPSGQTIQFPNRTGMEIDYIKIQGDFKVMSFQITNTDDDN